MRPKRHDNIGCSSPAADAPHPGARNAWHGKNTSGAVGGPMSANAGGRYHRVTGLGWLALRKQHDVLHGEVAKSPPIHSSPDEMQEVVLVSKVWSWSMPAMHSRYWGKGVLGVMFTKPC